MEDCVFCKILSGELPAHFVYKDNTAVAFLNGNLMALILRAFEPSINFFF